MWCWGGDAGRPMLGSMPDYGHPLLFGTFITPINGPAQQPVELAVLAEDLGFDLVTFQDHPYQPAFLDTWTLLAWVAARTKRVQVYANVLNLPLRPPAVSPRAAARRPLRPGARRGWLLGRSRGDGRAPAHSWPGR